MSKKTPPKLYTYQSLTDTSYTRENLQKRQIWCSKPEHLNDPFDCAVPFLLKNMENEKDWEAGYKGLLRRMKKDFSAEKATKVTTTARKTFLTNGKVNRIFRDYFTKVANEQIEENMKKIREHGVACFSEDYRNILMWSHYADGHKGLCLEFDTNYFPFNNDVKLQSVEYQDTYPLIHPTDMVTNKLIPHKTLITKSTNWCYEKEWRVIHSPGNTALEYNHKALTAIYFGCYVLKETIEEILSLTAKSAPRIYQMQRSKTEFKLEHVPYQP